MYYVIIKTFRMVLLLAWRESSETKFLFELVGSLIDHTEFVVCLIVCLIVRCNMLY